MKFSFIPAPKPSQTPAQRAEEVVPGSVVTADGYVQLPNDAKLLADAISSMYARERGHVLITGTDKELAHVAIVTLALRGIRYEADSTLSFAPNLDGMLLVRFFQRALPVVAPETATNVTAERPAELDEALGHLKRAGEALLPLLKREGNELFDELKTLFR